MNPTLAAQQVVGNVYTGSVPTVAAISSTVAVCFPTSRTDSERSHCSEGEGTGRIDVAGKQDQHIDAMLFC